MDNTWEEGKKPIHCDEGKFNVMFLKVDIMINLCEIENTFRVFWMIILGSIHYYKLTCNKVSTSGRQLGTRPRKTIWSACTPIKLHWRRNG